MSSDINRSIHRKCCLGQECQGIQPTGLVKELYHGDTLVATSLNFAEFPAQTTFPEADDTWRLRLTLAKESTKRAYTLTLVYPSMLPILTKKIPLAFLQQGFDSNWNGRDYISIGFVNDALYIHFDPELAHYYNIPNTDYSLGSFPGWNPPNIVVKDINLSIDSSSGPFGALPAPLAYVELSVAFTGADGTPISGSLEGYDFSMDDFSFSIKFYLTVVGEDVVFVYTDPPSPLDADSLRIPRFVGYQAQATTDAKAKFHSGDVGTYAFGKIIDDVLSAADSFLNGHPGSVGAVLTPWLLGAAFEVVSVQYSPINSQPVPPTPSPSGAFIPQGDLVIEYVGQFESASQGGGVIQQGPRTLTITTSTIPNGVIGTQYVQDFGAVSGVEPYVWTVTGTLPPGVVLAGSQLNGTPTAPGVYSIQAAVRDAAGTQVERSYTFATNAPGLSITTTNPLPGGTAMQDYAVVLVAQGGTPPFKWSADGLPSGLAISDVGVISGTLPMNGGVASVIAKVTDQKGATASGPLELTTKQILLFNDLIYSPRGDGNKAWQPPTVPSSFDGGGGVFEPPTNQGSLSNIEHIVVVMMENRSFDCMLGYLSKEGGRTDVEGLKWENDSNRTQFNYYQGRYYYPHRLTNTQAFTYESQGPDHSFESVKAQMADNMGHFVSDYAKNKVGDDSGWLPMVMGYYTGEQLPTYDLLAREFAICDHWFCSHPGPTWPNRFVTMTGELNRDSHGEPEVNTPLYSDFTPSEAPTLFDHLTDRNVSWQYFEQRASMMRAFTKYSFDMVNVLQFDDPEKGFVAAVNSGLKQVTFIDPLFGDLPAGLDSPQDNDDAPPSDLKFGQQFIEGIVNTLFTPGSNAAWQRTMLIIVYDEHGGFYDHVQPPDNAVPLTGQGSGKLGPRVPAFVVSAYTPPGLVLKDNFDHGSISATILRRFCSPNPPVMSPRVSAALDLRSALPLASPRGPFLLGNGNAALLPLRTDIRRFKFPQAADSYGAFLGGLSLSMGSAPRPWTSTGGGNTPPQPLAPTFLANVPSSLKFPNTFTGDVLSETFAITNTGTGAITVAIVGIPMGPKADFYWSSQKLTVDPGSSVNVGVTFSPKSEGLKGGVLTVTSNAVGSPFKVTLGGTGQKGEPK